MKGTRGVLAQVYNVGHLKGELCTSKVLNYTRISLVRVHRKNTGTNDARCNYGITA